jgi:general secretion pathway protein B
VSYILDALKKSEKERSLGNVPILGSADQNIDNKVSVRWFVLTSVLLLAVVFIVGGWLLRESGLLTDSRIAVEKKGEPAAENVTAMDQIPQAATQPETTANEHQEASSNKDEPVPVLELDPTVRGRLPEMSVNVLSYSDSRSRRFVMIDQNIFKEGEEVEKGVVVEEIRKSGVVFSFEDVQFILKP